MNKISKYIMFWFIVVGTISFIFLPFNSKLMPIETQELSFSKFVEYLQDGKIKKVYLPGSSSELSSKSFVVHGELKNNKVFKTVAPDSDRNFTERLLENRVEIIVSYDSHMLQYIFAQLLNLLPMLFLIGLVIFSVRQSKNGGNGGLGGGPFGFSKSKPKIFKPEDNKVTFEDVAGIDEAKQDLEEIVDFLKSPDKFQRLGGKIPRGVLLVGDPGNGKTLLAKAIANEAKVPFFSISGSDFVEVFVGVGASRVRRIFENAKKTSPCIVFIDEIDAVGKRRDMSLRGGNDEREQTLNQLLVEMDGFDENQGVIVIAATNRADILDPALLRPGRFDRTINVPYPDMKGREMILKVHSRKVPLAHDVNLKTIARGTPGFSGADLANLINESALLAARQNKLAVYMKDLEMAKDKIIMGSERKTLHMNDKEKKLTAYHESGHAIMALISPQYDPIHKVTIVPRGGALGMVVSLPEDDKVSMSRTELLSNIKVAMGGRASEEIFFGEENITTGASNDIEKATKIARNMMLKWGMSDKLGFQAFFTSQYYNDASDNVSQRTTEIIDKEVEALVKRLYKEVKTTLIENKDRLERIANKLLEKETLTGTEVKQLFDNTYVDTPENTVVDNSNNELLNEFALGGLPNIALPDNSKKNNNNNEIDTNDSNNISNNKENSNVTEKNNDKNVSDNNKEENNTNNVTKDNITESNDNSENDTKSDTENINNESSNDIENNNINESKINNIKNNNASNNDTETNSNNKSNDANKLDNNHVNIKEDNNNTHNNNINESDTNIIEGNSNESNNDTKTNSNNQSNDTNKLDNNYVNIKEDNNNTHNNNINESKINNIKDNNESNNGTKTNSSNQIDEINSKSDNNNQNDNTNESDIIEYNDSKEIINNNILDNDIIENSTDNYHNKLNDLNTNSVQNNNSNAIISNNNSDSNNKGINNILNKSITETNNKANVEQDNKQEDLQENRINNNANIVESNDNIKQNNINENIDNNETINNQLAQNNQENTEKNNKNK